MIWPFLIPITGIMLRKTKGMLITRTMGRTKI